MVWSSTRQWSKRKKVFPPTAGMGKLLLLTRGEPT
jgi:hypothetical protein